MIYLIILLTIGAGVSEKIAECPSPIRPTAALNHVYLDSTISLQLILEIRWCVTKEQKRNIFFRMMFFQVNKSFVPLPDFDVYDNYGMLPCPCSLMVIIEPNNTKPVELFQKTFGALQRFVIFLCDFQLSNCQVVLWKCGMFERHKDELSLSSLIGTMLSPKRIDRTGEMLRIGYVVIGYIAYLIVLAWVIFCNN